MKKRPKSLGRILALMLCAAVLVSTLPTVSAFASGAEQHEHGETDASLSESAVDTAGEEQEAEPVEPPAKSDGALRSGTFDEIQSWRCPGESPNGRHVLYSSSGIYQGARAIRNTRRYEGSCLLTKGASEERVCMYCHEWFTMTTVKLKEAPSHDFADGDTVVSECDGLTYATRICQTCGYVEVSISGDKKEDAVPHELVEVTSDADCKTDVSTVSTCSVCKAVVESTVKPAAGHSVYVRTTRNGTCKVNGEETATCYDCGYEEKTELPTAGRHMYGTSIVPATCLKDGYSVEKCIFCDELKERKELKALGHDWHTVDNSNGLCTESKEYEKCERCGETRETTGEKIDHLWSDETVVAPTCGTGGYTYKVCERCKTKKIIDGTETSATGQHRFSITVILKSPTCGTPGQEVKRCFVCGALDEPYETPATGKHIPNNDDGNCMTEVACSVCGAVTTPAQEAHSWYIANGDDEGCHVKKCRSCSAFEIEECYGEDDGDCTTQVKCAVCGKTVTPAMGYHTSGDCCPVDDENHVRLCGRAGCTQPVSGYEPHTYVDGVCSVCGHHLSDGHEHKPDGVCYSDDTLHWQLCTVCGERCETGSHDKTASDPYDGDCTKAVKCSVCDHTVRAAAEHTYSDTWETTNEYHYKMCVRSGCTHSEIYDHTVSDDRDCTTANVCTVCGQEVVSAGSAHSWVVDPTGSDESGHRLVCSNDGCDAEMTEEHKVGTEATCRDKAECSECHLHFGAVDGDNHVGGEELRNAKPATEYEEGYTGDLYCLGCGQMLTAGTAIEKNPPHTHEYSVLRHNGEIHWNVCSICGAVDEESVAAHAFGAYTADEGGTTHWRACSECGYVEHEVHEHSPENHDCTKPLCCVDCGAVVVEAIADEHDFTGRVTSTALGHVIACVNPNCSVVSEVIAHSGGSASCTSGAHCTVCGHEYTVKNGDVHTGGTEIRGQRDATVTEKGYTGDTYCLGCGKLISYGEDTDKLPEEHKHDFGDWTGDAAHHWKVCGCGETAERGEHEFADGVCTVCGAIDPNHFMLGDVDGDLGVGVLDALFAAMEDAGLTELNEAQRKAADVDGDGMVTSHDALLIAQFDAGLIDSLDVVRSE